MDNAAVLFVWDSQRNFYALWCAPQAFIPWCLSGLSNIGASMMVIP